MLARLRPAQRGFGGFVKNRFAGVRARENLFGFLRAPGFVRDAAERHARGLDLATIELQCGGDRDERNAYEARWRSFK